MIQTLVPIRSFGDARLRAILNRERPDKRFPADLIATTRRRLVALDEAESLEELRSPPGNRLHALKDDRAGQHAIRVNDQFRLVFIWTDEGPAEVELVDYH